MLAKVRLGEPLGVRFGEEVGETAGCNIGLVIVFRVGRGGGHWS